MSVRLPRVASLASLLVSLAGMSLLAAPAGAESPPPYVLQWGTYGTGLGQFHTPKGIAVDGSGNVFVTQVDIPCRVQKFTNTGSVLAAFGGCGTANGSFDYSWDCAVDPQGNLWVVDTRNDRVQKLTSNGTWLLNIGGYGSGNGQFNLPYGVAVDLNGNVYVTDRDNSRVQKFTSSGAFVTKWGSLGSGTGQFNKPIGIGVDPAGNVYVADAGNNRIEKFNSNGGYLSQLSAPGSGDGQFNTPGDIAFDQSGNMYVTDTGNYRVQKLTSNFAFITKWGTVGSGDGQFYGPWGITVDANNYVYVVDTANNRVEKFGPSGGGGGSGNTPSGSNVLVTIDPTVSLVYGQVLVPGNTTVTVRSTGAALPKGILPVPSNPPKFYDITTTAVFSGNIQVTLNYNTSDYRGAEANLMLYHYDTSLPVSSWRDVTASLNTSQNKITGTVQSLSVFIILEPGSPTAVGEDPAALEARLLPSAPNPFRASTQVGFSLPEDGPVRLQVFDLRGALVRTLVDTQTLPAGEHSFPWNGTDDRGLPQTPGMYFLQLATASGLKSQKVLLVR
jgi:DNA-binding beta-propeller fold protein YncE